MKDTPFHFEKNQVSALQDKLEFPRALLLQLRETRLFNPMIDEAIEDIDDILTMIQGDKPNDNPGDISIGML